MRLKSSFLSGEFWLFAAIAGVMLYLESKGITAADVQAKGELIIVKLQDWLAAVGPLLLAVAFGVKRYLLKAQQLKAELAVELERIRAVGREVMRQPVEAAPVRGPVPADLRPRERATWAHEEEPRPPGRVVTGDPGVGI
jgi:hypothetical protein